MGILTSPLTGHPKDLPTVLIPNAGLVHRVGPNRIHVKLARTLAAHGFKTVRFDVSGLGDSPAPLTGKPFWEQSVSDIQEVMDYLGTRHAHASFIVMGICTGADCAAHAARTDRRIVGMIGINGVYLDTPTGTRIVAASASRLQRRYYRKKMFSATNWLKLLSGKSDIRKNGWALLVRLVRTLTNKATSPATAPASQRPTVLSSLLEVDPRSLLVYSEGSQTLDVFELLHREALGEVKPAARVKVRFIQDCDHTFTLVEGQDLLSSLVWEWLTSSF